MSVRVRGSVAGSESGPVPGRLRAVGSGSAPLCVAGSLARLIGDGAGVRFGGDLFAQPVTRLGLSRAIVPIRRLLVAIVAPSGGWLLAGSGVVPGGSGGLLAFPAGAVTVLLSASATAPGGEAAAEVANTMDGDHLIKVTFARPGRRHTRG